MKKVSTYILLFALFSFNACSLFDIDNYDGPPETLDGDIVAASTGEPELRVLGSEGSRVRLTEVSWGDNVTPNPDFFCMPDGKFQNTKLFKGEYNIRIDGPFIPLIREDDRGVPLADETQTVAIQGTTKIRFEVQPFLKVEWVEEPQVINGRVRAKVRVTRAVSEQDFRDKIEPMGGYSNS